MSHTNFNLQVKFTPVDNKVIVTCLSVHRVITGDSGHYNNELAGTTEYSLPNMACLVW